MAGGRSPALLARLGCLGLALAVAGIFAAACGHGITTEPPAATEPTDVPTTHSPPFQTATEPGGDSVADLPPDAAADVAEQAGDTANAGTAGDDSLTDEDPSETELSAGLSAELEVALRSLLDELGAIAGAWNPAGRASVAVVTADGSLYGLNEHRQHPSASAAKAVWAAAAIDLAGIDAVDPLQEAALGQSDNFAAGSIIDLVGIDSVNEWGRDVASMTGTHLAVWNFGGRRVAQSVIDGGTNANLTTMADLALFYARLRQGVLLEREEADALEGWLRATPRGDEPFGSVSGVLLARLPTDVAAEASHKAGWLPPYCCRAEVRLVIDAGVIPLPDGSWFAIAAVSDRGDYYNLSVRWVSLAACRVYALLAGDATHDCDRPGDGVPRPDLWRPPPEPEPEDDDIEEPAPGSDEAEILPVEDEDEPEEPPGEADDSDLPPRGEVIGREGSDAPAPDEPEPDEPEPGEPEAGAGG